VKQQRPAASQYERKAGRAGALEKTYVRGPAKFVTASGTSNGTPTRDQTVPESDSTSSNATATLDVTSAPSWHNLDLNVSS
jgi:hypothetical protein